MSKRPTTEEIRMLHTYRIQRVLAWGAVVVAVVWVSARPLALVVQAVEALAGEDTTVGLATTIRISVLVSGGSIVALGVSLVRSWSRGKELQRFRERTDKLERALELCEDRLNRS